MEEERAMPDDGDGLFRPLAQPTSEFVGARRDHLGRFDGEAARIALLGVMPPDVRQVIEGEGRKFIRQMDWRAAHVAGTFQPFAVPAGDVDGDASVAESPLRRLQRAGEGRAAEGAVGVEVARVMRDAVKRMGADPKKINPLVPVDLVIDHSVQVDVFGNVTALERNAEIEFERNKERYEFLRWGQKAFSNFRVVPPATGIVHQVNLEYLARGVLTSTR